MVDIGTISLYQLFNFFMPYRVSFLNGSIDNYIWYIEYAIKFPFYKSYDTGGMVLFTAMIIVLAIKFLNLHILNVIEHVIRR